MTRDDRDIESSNPSKSFKVGDFDRLSGFFTPVWESKRRIRSESPIPSSGPASSKSGADKAPAKTTPAKGVEAAASPDKVAKASSAAPADAAASETSDVTAGKAAAAPAKLEAAKEAAPKEAAAKEVAAKEAAAKEVAAKEAAAKVAVADTPSPARAKDKESGAATAASLPSATEQQDPSALTKSIKATIRQGPSLAPSKTSLAPSKVEPPPAAAPAPTVAPVPAASAPTAAPVATVAARVPSDSKQKPAISFGNSAAPEKSKLTAPRPSVSALAQAGPNLPAEAFLDPKPDFRIPLSKSTPAPQAERIHTSRQRSLMASVAATRVHEQLRARAEADSFDAPELQWGTETDAEALGPQPSAAAAGAASDDPYPLHLLRRLRRTIHLATPLPESVREMIARYGRN